MHFPWDELSPYMESAITFARDNCARLIDLSIGTPVDQTPESIQQRLAQSTNAPGYPKTIGSRKLQESICQWLKSMRQVSKVEPEQVLPTVGSKEAVALLPLMLGLGSQDVLVRPTFAYPTYDIGAIGAGCEVVKLDTFDAEKLKTKARGKNIKLIWLNYPRNPTGECVDAAQLRQLLEAARSVGAVVASDECYALFDWREQAARNSHQIPAHPSILDDDVCGGDFAGILMLYSFSKQLNLAGYRSSFIAGDAKLIARIAAVRKQLGLIMPEPIQQATVAALEDVRETKIQIGKYRARHFALRKALLEAGYEILHSEGSLYVWVRAKSGNCWEDLRELSHRGCIVAPGEFYDESARGYLRISVTASDEDIAEFGRRVQ